MPANSCAHRVAHLNVLVKILTYIFLVGIFKNRMKRRHLLITQIESCVFLYSFVKFCFVHFKVLYFGMLLLNDPFHLW